jgi:signal transduction histidine kinase/ligand-binding sensor domain-containing protein
MQISLISRRLGVWKARNALPLCILATASFCPSLFALNPDWQIYQYGHRSWRIGDTFPGGSVNAVAQDAGGYLWLAASTGLFRFDGVRFTQWTPPQGSSLIGSILSVVADRDGTLWIGTLDGLSHWDHHQLIRYKVGQRVMVSRLFQDDEGIVWFAPYSFGNNSGDLLCKVAQAQLACDSAHAGLPTLAITRDSAGTIWLGESDSLISWRGGTTRSYLSPALKNNTSQGGVCAIVPDTDGSILVGIAKSGPSLGLQRFRSGRWIPVTAPGFNGSDHKVKALWMDQHHALWIGTSDEGIYRLYQGRVDHYNSRNGLSGDAVSAIYGDREGSVWVGTAEGLDQFRDLAVQAFSNTVYPRSVEFDNLVTTPDGTLWVGGEGSLYKMPRGGRTFIRQKGNLTGKQVTTIFRDQAGRIWIGLDNSLNIFADGRFTAVRKTDGSPTGFIVSMAEEPNGALWALTTGPPRTILSVDPNSLRATPGLPTVDASKIAGDPRGGLWIGLNTGSLLHYSQGEAVPVLLAQESHARISQLSVMPGGGVLAASESGLAYLLGREVHVLDTQNGLPCANVSNFVFDARGDLWLYMQCGLAKIDQSQFIRWLKDPSTQIEPRVFDAFDGFRIFLPPFEGATRSADGRLWFNNLWSLQMVDPDHLYVNTVPPPVHIEAVRADFRERALAPALHFPPLTRNIEIDYSALSLAVPQKNQFRYRLSGFDPDWHDAGTRRQAIYTNLAPGRYRFQVLASNNEGIWNMTGDAISFTIAPKFYQTNWFLATIVLAGLSLIYAVFIVRLRVSTKLVEDRMNERLLERDRIARELHDTLLQGFHGIVLRLQGIARMISDSAPARLTLEDTMDRADQILVEGRQNLLQLRSNATVQLRLAEQLNEVIDDLQQQRFIPCALNIKGQECALRSTVQDEIFAMAREAITNAFRHSRANGIAVELSYTPAQFALRCSDDGVGLPPAVLEAGSTEGHWGLVGLRERAENLRGRLILRSNRPHGTVVEIILRARIAYSPRGVRRLRRLVPGVRN